MGMFSTKTLSTTSLTLAFAVCVGAAAFAAPPPRHGGGHGGSAAAKEAAEAKEANEKAKRKIAHFLTDEGASGLLSWKEYTANPKALGETTLLVVFGGRDSIKGARGEAKVPVALDKALFHATLLPKSGKLVVLVPDMTAEWRRVGGKHETQVEGGLPDLVRSRAEAHGVKPERVFATGFSLGGEIVLNLLNDAPTLFARALVVAASGNSDATENIRAEILDYHGAADDYIPIVRIKAFAAAVNARKPDLMKLETLPKTGHAESEAAAYAKIDAWKWLFRPEEQKTATVIGETHPTR